MNVTMSTTDELNAVLTVQFEEIDYKDNVEKTLADYRKNANLPGFRKGKVPAGLIRKQYGKGALIDEVNKQLQSSVSEYITKEKLELLGNPLPVEKTDIDWDNSSTFSFDFELGLAPKIEVAFPARKKFDSYSVKASAEAMEEQILNMAKRYGKMSTPDKAQDDDMFSGSFVEIDKDGEIVSNGISKEGAYFIGTALEKKTIKNKVLKAKIGDDQTISASDFAEGFNLAEVLGTNEHQLNDHSTGIFNFTLTHISRVEPAELNQELFDKVFGEGTIKSEEEFRARVASDLENMYVRDADQHMMNQVSEYLMENIDVTLPEAFLKKWMQTSGEKPLTAEEVEVQFPDMAKGLKWQLIENRVIQDNNLKAEYAELLDYTKQLLRDQYVQYGMAPDEEQVTKSATDVLQNQEEAQRINDRLYDEKLKGYFKTSLKLNEKEIAYDDFVKLVSKQKA